MTYTHEFLKRKQPDIEKFLDGIAAVDDSKFEEIFESKVPDEDLSAVVEKSEEALNSILEFLCKTQNELVDELISDEGWFFLGGGGGDINFNIINY